MKKLKWGHLNNMFVILSDSYREKEVSSKSEKARKKEGDEKLKKG
jgi:hypothetical protein